ncbi:MAG TPA: ABC transporter substrate-binding protein [Jatrophihabitantaceae bacterium]|nr:ABC transporter substrate-binding protein [Jatrophihabitantaceae bacterium]
MILSTHGRRALIALAAVTLCSLLAGCGSSGAAATSDHTRTGSSSSPHPAGFPVTVHAANGAVTIASEPHAIVSLSPTATEDLYAIGAGSQVVAVDKNSDYPAGLPTDRIDAYHLNVEALTKFRPDLVVAAGLTAAQLAKLRTLGITVLSEPAAARLSDAYRQIIELGDATGHATKADSVVATMKQRIAAVVSSVAKQATGRSYYYELDQTYYSVTSSTFIGQLLGLLGLHSIADAAKGAASSGGYPQLDAEFILKSNPNYLFLADTLCCRQSTTTVANRPGWSTLTAVKDGRVVELNDDIASRWGPRIVELLRTVANAIDTHPVGP